MRGMHRPGRKFANFSSPRCICPAALIEGVTADKEASMTTAAESPAAAQLAANKAVVRSFADAWNRRDFGRFQTLMGEGAASACGKETSRRQASRKTSCISAEPTAMS